MRISRLAAALLLIVVGCTSLLGCASADYVSPQFVVFDGETNQPIKDAYIHAPGEWGTSTRGGKTDANGRAKVRMAQWVSEPSVEASGYLISPYLDPPRDRVEIRVALYRAPIPVA